MTDKDIEISPNIKEEVAQLDKFTQDHSNRVAKLTAQFAKNIKLDIPQSQFLVNAALIHDIGKRNIPEKILYKPSELTDKEFKIVQTHTIHGYEICMDKKELQPFANIARHHHERIDGKGYPDNITDKLISYSAKTISVIDAYEAVTATNREYKEPWIHERAKNFILSNTNTRFDPVIAQTFINMMDKEIRIEAKERDSQPERQERIKEIMNTKREENEIKGLKRDPDYNREYKMQAKAMVYKYSYWPGPAGDVEITKSMLKQEYSHNQIKNALSICSPEVSQNKNEVNQKYIDKTVHQALKSPELKNERGR